MTNTQYLLEQLVRFQTITSNQPENSRALTWIEDQIKDLPLHISRNEYEGYHSLVITTQKTKTPKIWLQGHLDVVPGNPSDFIPTIKGNRLFGRGTFDMKFAIASYIVLLKSLGDNLPEYDFGIMITCDEEIGGNNGVKALIEDGYLSKVCVIPDGGEDWKFQTWAKGILQLRVEAKGKATHGSRTWLGENAIIHLADFLKELVATFPTEPCNDKIHAHDTINVGVISGGKAANQVPDLASAILDVRFTPKNTKEKMLKKIEGLAKKFSSKICVEEVISGVSYTVDMNNPYLKSFKKIVKDETGITMGEMFTHGSSDARFFAEKNIPTILMRPRGGGHHSKNEWINIKDLEMFSVIIEKFIKEHTSI